jgi:hypothetical protein
MARVALVIALCSFPVISPVCWAAFLAQLSLIKRENHVQAARKKIYETEEQGKERPTLPPIPL